MFDAMGLAGAGLVTIESLAGTTMSGRVVEHVTVGELNGVRVEVEASAWIVADHEFFLEPTIRWRTASRGEQACVPTPPADCRRPTAHDACAVLRLRRS